MRSGTAEFYQRPRREAVTGAQVKLVTLVRFVTALKTKDLRSLSATITPTSRHDDPDFAPG